MYSFASDLSRREPAVGAAAPARDGASGLPDASKTILAPRLDGSFRWTDGDRATEVVRTPGGFRIDAGAGTGWTIEDRRGDDRGYVLWDERRGERRCAARTSRPPGFEAAPTLLLEDGRLFRIRIRGLAPPRVEMHGDAVVGAYLEATLATIGWEIVTTPAGESLGAPPEALWLFGAELTRLASADAGSGAMHG